MLTIVLITQFLFDAFYFQSSLFGFASFFGVLAVAVDRFLAIHLHLRKQELVTHNCVVAVASSFRVLNAFIALLGLKWIRILGFISIQLPSEEE